MQDREQLERLLTVGYPCLSICTLEEDYALALVRETAVLLNRRLWLWTATHGLHDGLIRGGRVIGGTDSPGAALAHLAELRDGSITAFLDLAPHLSDARTLRSLRSLVAQLTEADRQLVLIDYASELPPVLAAVATPVELHPPRDAEIESLIRDTLRRAHRESPIEIDIRRGTLDLITRNLQGLTRRQIELVIRDVVVSDRRFDDADLNHVLAQKRRLLNRGGLLEHVETPVSLDAIGGLRRLKAWLRERDGALGEAGRAFGLPTPRGVLLLGVQGAGKSLSAKAIATAWNRPLLRLDAGVLYDRYVGESERRLREALRQAEAMSPAVLWIDEIEKAFASAAVRSADGGLSQRMFATLLTWMQERDAPVFLVATANDIDALPPELLRKGRFDEIFFVDLPARDVRREILCSHLRNRQRDPQAFDLDRLATTSEGCSGAEIEQAVLTGLHAAFAAKRELSTEDLVAALSASPPLSVVMAERIAALRAWAATRCRPAD